MLQGPPKQRGESWQQQREPAPVLAVYHSRRGPAYADKRNDVRGFVNCNSKLEGSGQAPLIAATLLRQEGLVSASSFKREFDRVAVRIENNRAKRLADILA